MTAVHALPSTVHLSETSKPLAVTVMYSATTGKPKPLMIFSDHYWAKIFPAAMKGKRSVRINSIADCMFLSCYVRISE